jgi:hypothetical protein
MNNNSIIFQHDFKNNLPEVLLSYFSRSRLMNELHRIPCKLTSIGDKVWLFAHKLNCVQSNL